MPMTPKQQQLAETIDRWVQHTTQRGGGEAELLGEAADYLATFKQIMDCSTPAQMNQLCATYPGFFRFAKLLEQLAQGIQDGTITVPPPPD